MVGGQLAIRDYAPFIELAAPMAAHPSRLEYTQQAWERDAVLRRVGVGAPIRVRRQMIGNREQPIWGLVFSRLGHQAANDLNRLPTYDF